MGCNCTKKTSNYQYEFTAPDGSTAIFPSETQARAAKIRAGGGSIRTVAK